MGTLKTEVGRTNKQIIKTRIAELEKKVKLLEAVTANLVREVAAKANIEALLKQPGAVVEKSITNSENA